MCACACPAPLVLYASHILFPEIQQFVLIVSFPFSSKNVSHRITTSFCPPLLSIFFILSLSLSLSSTACSSPPQVEELRMELNKREQEFLAMGAKMKTLEEQHHDYQRHIAVLKESLCAKEEHQNMLQADVRFSLSLFRPSLNQIAIACVLV